MLTSDLLAVWFNDFRKKKINFLILEFGFQKVLTLLRDRLYNIKINDSGEPIVRFQNKLIA